MGKKKEKNMPPYKPEHFSKYPLSVDKECLKKGTDTGKYISLPQAEIPFLPGI